jgi:electron transfer flavoprotein beta subunit
MEELPAMNILVCVKQIPDPNAQGKIDPQSKRLVREGVDLVLDPGDEHAVEAGLQLIEKGGGEVTVISMGPPRAQEAIRRALAMGAHRGIHVSDPGLENSDALSTAKAIAAAIKAQSYELIICGTESTDGSSGAVPAQLAELLGLPLLSFAKKLEVSDGKAVIDRQTDEGYDVVEAPTPAVVTVTGGINEARYPALRGIMQAKNREVKQMSLDDLGLRGQAGKDALTQEVTEIAPAEARKAGEVVEDKGEGAKRIADFLAQLKVI